MTTMKAAIETLRIKKSTTLDTICSALIEAGYECYGELAREIKAAVLAKQPVESVIGTNDELYRRAQW